MDVAEVLAPPRGYDADSNGQADLQPFQISLPKGDFNRRDIGLSPVGIEGLGGDLNALHVTVRQKSGP